MISIIAYCPNVILNGWPVKRMIHVDHLSNFKPAVKCHLTTKGWIG